MELPQLNRSARSREFVAYTDEEIGAVVKAHLFSGISHRQIDRDVLHLDSSYTRGYQSMGILHYLGLRKEFRGIFAEKTIDEAIQILKESGSDDYTELIEILSNINYAPDYQSDIEAETATTYEVNTEGKKKQYFTTRYERNPANRKAAIEYHGTRCMACGFDFEKMYGARGKNYIEVHHVKPLSTVDEEVMINPETDLVVVCSNCHRMIHRKKNEILSIEELKQIISSQIGSN